VIGLFLGAGASYELGMPLVTELTAEFKAYLNVNRIEAFNAQWRAQGGGYSNEIVDELNSLVADASMHYEAIIGYFQTQANRFSAKRNEYRHLSLKLTDAVYGLLYSRHIRNIQYIEEGLRFFDGLAGLANHNAPLWIFSLNHDMMIECIAGSLGLKVSAGLLDRGTIPRRTFNGDIIGFIQTETLRGDVLDSQGPTFSPLGEHGINLLKIHGGLDLFMTNDGDDVLRLLPFDYSVEGIVGPLRAAHEDLGYRDPSTGVPLTALREEVYVDIDGEVQFLQRSLLTGRFKYERRQHQILPPSYLSVFRKNIGYVNSLVCIGYGFGDDHINAVLREWLEADVARKLEIVSPGVSAIPPTFLHLTPQVTKTAMAATEWLEKYSPRPLSMIERTRKIVRIAER
jgi:hypothetical protein